MNFQVPIIVIFVLVPWQVLLFIIMTIRRNVMPLKARPYPLLFIISFTSIAQAVFPHLYLNYYSACPNGTVLLNICSMIFGALFLVSMALRGYRLIKIFDWNYYMKNQNQNDEPLLKTKKIPLKKTVQNTRRHIDYWFICFYSNKSSKWY